MVVSANFFSYVTSYYSGSIVRYIRRYTAISRKVVGKSARDNPERYCGWFWVRCSSKKFERMAQEAVDVCLRVLKESNKRNFDNYSVRNSVLIISLFTFRDCCVHIFADNLSKNSCIYQWLHYAKDFKYRFWLLSLRFLPSDRLKMWTWYTKLLIVNNVLALVESRNWLLPYVRV